MLSISPRAWIRLPVSGGRLDLLNPSPQTWSDEDLAVRIARTYRWGGDSAWPLPLSVAQHSLSVLALRRQWAQKPLPVQQQLKCLLHDGEEAFLSFDCITPLKGVLGQPFKDVCDRLMDAIEIRYSLDAWEPEEYRVHKEADRIAAACEAVHVVGWQRQEVREVLGITHAVLEEDPLPRPLGYAPWEPWPATLAADLFLQELRSLTHASRR
jgi:5'-deoxynucleotidase YfbR-like HD superfamily hydrolase